MRWGNNRNFKILGAAWLVLGGLGFALVVLNLTLDYPPSATEGSDGYWVFLILYLVMGAIGLVNGLALLRRIRVARRLVAISSLVLLLPSAAFIVPLLVVGPSLWLWFGGGKEAFESYIARDSG